MKNYKTFIGGISLAPKVTTQNNLPGDLEFLTDGFVYIRTSANERLVTDINTLTGANRLKNKDLDFSTIKFSNGTNTLQFSSSLTANRTLTIPDTSDTAVLANFAQTLTNKTLTSPVLNTATADTITGIAGGSFFIRSALNENLVLSAQGTGVVSLEDLLIDGNTITGGASNLTVQSASNQNLNINSQGTGVLNLQQAGSTQFSVDSLGLLGASGKVLRFVANSQTLTLGFNSAASATYSVLFPATAPSANTSLVYNGTDFVWSTAGGWQVSNATSLTNGGTVSISVTAGQQVFRVQGNSSAVTLSTTPFGTTAPVNGASVRLIGTSNTNTVTITNSDTAKGCILNGNVTLGQYDVIEFQYVSSDDRYVEVYRNF